MMKKGLKNTLAVLLCFFVATANFGRAECVFATDNEYVLWKYYLVDSGKHLDWDGSTNYLREWYAAVNVWNSYKPGVIRVDTWKTIQDVKIMDKPKYDGFTFAMTFASGKIVFYQDTMDTMTTTQRQATIMHEIGHALGIAHNINSNSIMRQGLKDFTKLHDIDKAAYDASLARIK